MKKTKKTMLTAAMFTAALGLTGCNTEEIQDVYGPPVDIEEETEFSSDEDEVYTGTTEATPDINEIQLVYGPPNDLD